MIRSFGVFFAVLSGLAVYNGFHILGGSESIGASLNLFDPLGLRTMNVTSRAGVEFGISVTLALLSINSSIKERG